MFKKEENMNKNSNGVNTSKKFLNSPYSFIFALITAFFAIFLGSGGEKEENGI